MGSKQSEASGESRGCSLMIGLIIIAICIGNIYSAVAGWLVIGLGLVMLALL